MLSKEMEKQINIQINKELYSGYYYLAMAAFFDAQNLGGFANFFKVQAKEEAGHAMKMYEYVVERGGRVVLEAVEKPPVDYKDAEEIFKLAYEHEQLVTSLIYKLVDLAIKENDHATRSFLDWFVKEQVEEEASMDNILQKIKMGGKSGHMLFMLDSRLGERGK